MPSGRVLIRLFASRAGSTGALRPTVTSCGVTVVRPGDRFSAHEGNVSASLHLGRRCQVRQGEPAELVKEPVVAFASGLDRYPLRLEPGGVEFWVVAVYGGKLS
jgi:hypothetical protein